MSTGYFSTPQSLLSSPNDLHQFARKLANKVKLTGRLTYDDVVQDAAIVVLERCREWENGQFPDVRVPFEAWVWTRCLGDLRDRYKKQNARFARSAPRVIYDSDYPDTEFEYSHAVPYAERDNVVREDADESARTINAVVLNAALELLTDDQRDAIKAVYIDGLTQAEYGASVGISQPAVSNLIVRGLRRLKQEMTV